MSIINHGVPMLGSTFRLDFIHCHPCCRHLTLWLELEEASWLGRLGDHSWIRVPLTACHLLAAQVLSDVMVSVLCHVCCSMMILAHDCGIQVLGKSRQWGTAGFGGSFLNTFLVLGAIVFIQARSLYDH